MFCSFSVCVKFCCAYFVLKCNLAQGVDETENKSCQYTHFINVRHRKSQRYLQNHFVNIMDLIPRCDLVLASGKNYMSLVIEPL